MAIRYDGGAGGGPQPEPDTRPDWLQRLSRWWRGNPNQPAQPDTSPGGQFWQQRLRYQGPWNPSPAWAYQGPQQYASPQPEPGFQPKAYGELPVQRNPMEDPERFLTHEYLTESMPGGSRWFPYQYPSLASLTGGQRTTASGGGYGGYSRPYYRGYGGGGGGGSYSPTRYNALRSPDTSRWLQAMVSWKGLR